MSDFIFAPPPPPPSETTGKNEPSQPASTFSTDQPMTPNPNLPSIPANPNPTTNPILSKKNKNRNRNKKKKAPSALNNANLNNPNNPHHQLALANGELPKLESKKRSLENGGGNNNPNKKKKKSNTNCIGQVAQCPQLPPKPAQLAPQTVELFPGMPVAFPVEQELKQTSTQQTLNTDQGDTDDKGEEPVDGLAIKQPSPPSPTSKSKTKDVHSDDDDNDLDISDDESNLSSKIVPIPGTNIILETEEDIQKWIEERKKNWPTDKRIQLKKEQKLKEEQILRNLTASSSLNATSSTGTTSTANGGGNKRICKFWMRAKRCRNGDKCKFLHIDSTDAAGKQATLEQPQNQNQPRLRQLPNHKIKLIHGIPIQIPKRFTPSVNKGRSLHNLLVESNRLKDENLILLDVFKKLMDNGQISRNWDTLKRKLNIRDE